MDKNPETYLYTFNGSAGDVDKVVLVRLTDKETKKKYFFGSLDTCHNVNYRGFECSYCGAWLTDDYTINGKVNFCPNCGRYVYDTNNNYNILES